MARVSFSQYALYNKCPMQYKLQYVDKLSESTANIHTLFGSAIHTTIQHFLSIMYGTAKSQAMKLDTDKMLLDEMKKEFIKENKKLSEGTICTKLELEEFYGDGRRIIEWFKKNLEKFYTKNGYELVAIEMPLNKELRPNIYFIGFIDVVVKDLATDEYILIDLKTSTRGWNKYQKSDPFKNAQIVMYKKIFSELKGISLDKIKVEYQIMRRKLYEDAPFPIPYMSKHVPASGKPTINKVYKNFMEFVDTVFDEDGNFNKDVFPKNPGERNTNCKWCEFYKRHCDGKAEN